MVTLGFAEMESANSLEMLMINYRFALKIVLRKLLSPTTAIKLNHDYIYGSSESIISTAFCSVLFVPCYVCYVDVLKKENEIMDKTLMGKLGCGKQTLLFVFNVSRQLINFKQKLGLGIMWKKNRQKGKDADLEQ
ncbi:phosphate import ATP-binding protein pstB [Striga asiatica]|uniref:Phosphate import ATP-binding protein pstB n=1 Tax=Striga asiatica TaxID=4170 RepID=A0A5A7QF52_STRAF|nr:phosphate import ATP-binding protein pstB [Striga asiatica]